MEEHDYIRLSEAAKLANVSLSSIRGWILEGFLHQTRVLQMLTVSKKELQAIIDARIKHPTNWKKYMLPMQEKK